MIAVHVTILDTIVGHDGIGDARQQPALALYVGGLIGVDNVVTIDVAVPNPVVGDNVDEAVVVTVNQRRQ